MMMKAQKRMMGHKNKIGAVLQLCPEILNLLSISALELEPLIIIIALAAAAAAGDVIQEEAYMRFG